MMMMIIIIIKLSLLPLSNVSKFISERRIKPDPIEVNGNIAIDYHHSYLTKETN